jgi:hypothetical protein
MPLSTMYSKHPTNSCQKRSDSRCGNYISAYRFFILMHPQLIQHLRPIWQRILPSVASLTKVAFVIPPLFPPFFFSFSPQISKSLLTMIQVHAKHGMNSAQPRAISLPAVGLSVTGSKHCHQTRSVCSVRYLYKSNARMLYSRTRRRKCSLEYIDLRPALISKTKVAASSSNNNK